MTSYFEEKGNRFIQNDIHVVVDNSVEIGDFLGF